MSDARQVLYWLAYAVAVPAVHLAARWLWLEENSEWNFALDVVVAAKAVPVTIWIILIPARPNGKIAVVLGAAIVWAAHNEITRSWHRYEGELWWFWDLAGTIGTLLLAIIVRRLAGTIRPEDANGARAAYQLQFSTRDLFALTAAVAVLITGIGTFFAGMREQPFGGILAFYLLWVAGTGSLFGVWTTWAVFSTRRRTVRCAAWLVLWLIGTLATIALFQFLIDEPPTEWWVLWVCARVHLGQSLLTAMALAPWWLRGYCLCLPEQV